ncbi:hypothetical protein CEXT_476961 [Caerostris extrusa]|uniref:Transposase n=1 Tax=Caerostris extrusa TaxID=172846 RepID=A0AAV4PWV5_CAEEX|nr:hypothetical protein CEXT_476961 [Caerostris extrusa]
MVVCAAIYRYKLTHTFSRLDKFREQRIGTTNHQGMGNFFSHSVNTYATDIFSTLTPYLGNTAEANNRKVVRALGGLAYKSVLT